VTGSTNDFFIQYFNFESPLIKIQSSVDILPGWSCICNDSIYIGDQATGTLNVISPNGTVVKKLNTFGKDALQFHGIGEIVISPKGYCYIIDQNIGKVHIFTKDLFYLKSIIFAQKDIDAIEVDYNKRPHSIAFDSYGNFYIADLKNIYKYKLE
jgi:hypothetical protein